MATRRPDAGTLSARRAFVVHFASQSGRRRRFIGRAEHLSSGRVTQFFSLAELLRFIALAPDGAEATRDLPRQSTRAEVSRPARAPLPTPDPSPASGTQRHEEANDEHERT